MRFIYLEQTVRHLKKNKAYLLINLIGLTVGIASFILITTWIRTETSFDRFHKNADDIYRVDYRLYEEGILEQHSASGSGAVAREMKNNFAEVKAFTRLVRSTGTVRYADNIFKEKNIFYAESSFFDLFSFPLLRGEADSGILAINNAVITEETARKYFGAENPVGKMIKIDGQTEFMVKAVLKDLPENSHLDFDILLSYENLIKMSKFYDNSWVSENVYSYVMLNHGADPVALESKLPAMVESFIGKFMKEAFFLLEFKLVKLTDIHLHSSANNEIRVNGSYRSIVTLGIVALLVLLIGFINYINLATSRSLERAHEVGTRKIAGATRLDLIKQFLSESAFLNFISLTVSFVAVVVLLPFFRQLMGSPLKAGFISSLLLFVVLIISGTLLTGLFPAVYISHFSPGMVLKGKKTLQSDRIGKFKNFLVLFQFTASVILIICTMIIFRQISFMRNHDTGFRKEGLLVLEGPRILNIKTFDEYIMGIESFKNESRSLPMVKGVTLSSTIPGREVGNSRVFGVPVEGRNTEKRIDIYYADNEFFSTYELKFIAGGQFAASAQEDMNKIILNESALEYYGFKDAEASIGKILRGGKQEVTVKAVIKDFNQLSLKELPRPLAFFNQPANVYYSIRTDLSDSKGLISGLEKIWTTHYPGNPFIYYFLSDFYDEQYSDDKRFFILFLISSIIAVIIACLGLYGLSAHAITRRTKEIGIRKSNGATTAEVLMLLNRDFLKWVLLSVILAIPVSFWLMSSWLENYPYQITMKWWIFVVSGIITLLTAFLTISWQSQKAAAKNPVEALRYE
ncbi:MAG TPA: ABC transporter permease [Bacteroidales bacterium]|nr:ABC transporter permease [Bacteroidales bacterium]